MNKRELEYYRNIKRNPAHPLFEKLFYITPDKVIMPNTKVALSLDDSGNPVIKNKDAAGISKVYKTIMNGEKTDLSFEEKYNEFSNTIANNSRFGNRSIFYSGIRIFEGLYINKQ